MTLDLSNLTPEKSAFLKAHPDLLKSLESGITQQAVRVQSRKRRENHGKAKWQRRIEDVKVRAEEARRMAEQLRLENLLNLPYYLRSGFSGRSIQGMKGLICPVCGRSDQECGHNKMNGKPWCFKCKAPLIPKNKLKKWRKMAKVRAVPFNLKDEFKRRGLDF